MITLSLRAPSTSSIYAWQLGVHEWLIQRALLPLTFASTMYSSFSVNRKVWPVSAPSSYRRSAWAWVMRRPLYWISTVRAGISVAAYTPLPWMGERRTIKRLVMSNLSRTNAYDALTRSHHTTEVAMAFK